MAITVTYKGSDAQDSSVGISVVSCTFSAGDSVIICGASDSVYAGNLRQDTTVIRLNTNTFEAYNAGNVVTHISIFENLTAEEVAQINNVSFGISGSGDATTLIVYAITGLTTSSSDKSGTGTGSGTTMSATTSAYPTTAGDLAVAAVGIEYDSSDGQGSWSNLVNFVHENNQYVGSSSGGAKGITLQTAANLVDVVIDAESGYLTYPSKRDWAMLVVTFRQAAEAPSSGYDKWVIRRALLGVGY